MSTILSYIVNRLYIIPGILIGLSVHEFGHAKAAQLCGDHTSEAMGRVSLDPRAHIDPVGLLMLLIVGFGWGKPVIVDPRNYRHPRRDSIIVGLAGVFNNLITIGSRILRSQPAFGSIVITLLLQIVVINLSLMLFNLLPVPPLDGFGVICGIFNLYGTKFYWYARRYGMVILILMMYFGLTSRILSPALNAVLSLVIRLASIGL